MPMLNCYVDDRTLMILEREVVRRGNGETATHLAENAIAEAAINSLRGGPSIDDIPSCGSENNYGGARRR